jgi:hypothetical protein
MGSAVREAGRTVRLALQSWHHTARLALLLVVGATAGAMFVAIWHLH